MHYACLWYTDNLYGLFLDELHALAVVAIGDVQDIHTGGEVAYLNAVALGLFYQVTGDVVD